ncbi:MAG TPA: CHAT domain-containing protein, partial [Blastocatellia bacterium]|nr:CHAT domain-containing protein [Blastocatellia bacterium]
RLLALDFESNRSWVLSPRLSEYRILHLATHGVLDDQNPGLSCIILSMVDERGHPQNGLLLLSEVYNLNLPVGLVVLSGCKTGLGKPIKGEGLIGLTRGFIYAGAARVVVSLWEVNDEATAELMKNFYEAMLRQGRRPAEALRAAQLFVWKQTNWKSPYYWAPFIFQGEWKE